jgi:fructokinase
MTSRIGIDLGGTKIELRLVADVGRSNSASGGSASGNSSGGNKNEYTRRVPTPRGDYGATVEAIADLVAEAKSRIETEDISVGVGIPGTVDRHTGTVKNANSNWLIGRPLGQDLENALGCPVRVANDANCFALSEAVDGAGAGFSSVFGVILGTGVGGGLVLNRQIIDGANLIAGEWGHNPLPRHIAGQGASSEDPRPCYCGRADCIESYLSGPALVGEFTVQNGTAETVEDILAARRAGDPAAEALLDRFFERLAASLAGVITILDPDVIVFGGGVSNIDALAAEMSARVPRYVFSAGGSQLVTRFADNHWGDSGGARGAAWLWSEGL